jgi:hypothetical protein
MLSLEDNRWTKLVGGYRILCDPRPLLAMLEEGQAVDTAWRRLWEELHHQGDVGDASYAAVPHLIRIYKKSGVVDWNTYAIVAIIELARNEGDNPNVPEWLAESYFCAIRELAEVGATEVLLTEKSEVVRSILSVLAIAGNLRTHGRFLLQYSEDELLDIESRE